MRVIVTAGPTIEPLDQVRRLTNFSTGRLGCELANHLAREGHQVTLLLSEQATYAGPAQTADLHLFSTTASLKALLQERASAAPGAICHAAAVSDFRFGQVFQRQSDQTLIPLPASGKIGSRQSPLLVELHPAEKIIASLAAWFPRHFLVGWKFEVDGTRDEAVQQGSRQMAECGTHACVVNGPAYGAGFGWLTSRAEIRHLDSSTHLFQAIHEALQAWEIALR